MKRESLVAKAKRYYPYLIILIFAFLLILPQVMQHATIVGFDSYFHMSRAYETMMQLKTGHLSYFLSLFSWHGCGRIVNGMYGPLGGYFMGLILLLVHSWYRWQIVMDLIVFAGSGSAMFKLGKYWNSKVIANLIISLLYMTSIPVFIFSANTSFTGVGSIFVPIAVLMISKMMHEDKVPTLQLTLLITFIAEIHLMTSLIIILFLLPCTIVMLIKSKHRLVNFEKLIAAAFISVVLTVNVWGAWLEVAMSNSNHIIPTFPAQGVMSSSWYNAIRFTGGSFSVIGGGIAVLCILGIIVWAFAIKTNNYIVNTIVSVGIFFLWLSSEWFPWETVQKLLPIINTIQFPKRFAAMGIVPIFLAAEAVLSIPFKMHANKFELIVIIFAMAIGASSFYHDAGYYQPRLDEFSKKPVILQPATRWTSKPNYSKLRRSLSSNNPSTFMNIVTKPVPDYLPTSYYYVSSKYQSYHPYWNCMNNLILPFALNSNNRRMYKKSITGHGQETIRIKSNYTGKNRIPYVKYAHTQVSVNHKRIHVPAKTLSQAGAMWLKLHKGENTITFRYQPSRIYEAGILISLIFWYWLLKALYLKDFKKQK